jgi:hypothetical protein
MKTIQTFIAILCVFALTNCSSEKKAERIPLDYNLPCDAYQPRLTSSDPATWKPIDRNEKFTHYSFLFLFRFPAV